MAIEDAAVAWKAVRKRSVTDLLSTGFIGQKGGGGDESRETEIVRSPLSDVRSGGQGDESRDTEMSRKGNIMAAGGMKCISV